MDTRRAAGWILVALGIGAALVIGGVILSTFVVERRGGVMNVVSLAFTLLIALSIPLVFGLVGWRLAHPASSSASVSEAAPGPRPRSRHAPIPPPDSADDVASVPEPVTACPRCGFLGIRMPTIGDGLWPGGGETGARMVCPRCDWQGIPLRFERREHYVEFLRGLQAP